MDSQGIFSGMEQMGEKTAFMPNLSAIKYTHRIQIDFVLFVSPRIYLSLLPFSANICRNRFKIFSWNFQLFGMYCKFLCCPFALFATKHKSILVSVWERDMKELKLFLFFFNMIAMSRKYVPSFISTKNIWTTISISSFHGIVCEREREREAKEKENICIFALIVLCDKRKLN